MLLKNAAYLNSLCWGYPFGYTPIQNVLTTTGLLLLVLGVGIPSPYVFGSGIILVLWTAYLARESYTIPYTVREGIDTP